MNQVQILGAMACLVTCLLLYVAAYGLAAWVRPHLRGKLAGVIALLFPALKLEPWLFDPIAERDLPPKQREFFHAHTPSFIARNYAPLGDFVLLRDKQPSCVRLFLSPDRTVLGGLSCYQSDQAIDAMSVLLDGTYLETATVRLEESPPKEHGLRFFSHPTRNALDLLDHHAQCVAEVALETGAPPTLLEPGDFQGVMNYGRQLSLRSLYRQGVLEELPEFLRRQETAAVGP